MTKPTEQAVAAFLDAKVKELEAKHPGNTIEITRQHTGNEETDLKWFIIMQVEARLDLPTGSGDTLDKAYAAMLKDFR